MVVSATAGVFSRLLQMPSVGQPLVAVTTGLTDVTAKADSLRRITGPVDSSAVTLLSAKSLGEVGGGDDLPPSLREEIIWALDQVSPLWKLVRRQLHHELNTPFEPASIKRISPEHVSDELLLRVVTSVLDEAIGDINDPVTAKQQVLIRALADGLEGERGRAILSRLLPDRKIKARFLTGLIVHFWASHGFLSDPIDEWVQVLFPKMSVRWKYEMGCLEKSLFDVFSATVTPKLFMDELEKLVLGEFERVDDILVWALGEVSRGRDRETALDLLAFRVALSDVCFDLPFRLLEQSTRVDPVRREELHVLRHNFRNEEIGLVTAVRGYLAIDIWKFLSDHFGETLDAQCRMALFMVAVLDSNGQLESDGFMHYRGHIPAAVIRRYKLRPVAEEARIDVDIAFSPDLHELQFSKQWRGKSIAQVVRQLLKNLVSNAIKYSNLDEEHPRFDIKVERVLHSAIIFCSDNGQGGAVVGARRHRSEARGTSRGLRFVQDSVGSLGGIFELSSVPKTGRVGGSTTVMIIIPRDDFEQSPSV